MTNDRPTVELLLAAIVSGVRTMSLPLPARGDDPADYAAFLERCRTREEIEFLVARDDVAELLRSYGVPCLGHGDLDTAQIAAPSPTGFELVQFTSGSTAAPKPVLLTDDALGINVASIIATVRPVPGDHVVSWLPLSHDMGLIGMLLTSVASGAKELVGEGHIVLLSPEEFIRRPQQWLVAMAAFNASFTAAPDFGFRMAARVGYASDLDLSCVRCAIVGGELVRRSTLTDFEDRFGGAGWSSSAFSPAYGMAEVGLAISITDPDDAWSFASLDTADLSRKRVSPSSGVDSTSFVSCGRPLPGYSLHFDDPNRISPIAVSGPSLARNAWTGETFGDVNSRYQPGDVGFMYQEEVYVVGRYDDYLVVHGQNIYAPQIEAVVGEVAGVRAGRCAAVGLPSGDWVMCVELEDAVTNRDAVRSEVRLTATKAASGAPHDVLIVSTGGLPLTASGKLQRNRVRASIVDGSIRLSEGA